jgi:hypothetical protein
MEKTEGFVGLTVDERTQLTARIDEHGIEATAKQLKLSIPTVATAMAGARTRPSTREAVRRFLRGPIADEADQERSVFVNLVGTAKATEALMQTVQTMAEALGCKIEVAT